MIAVTAGDAYTDLDVLACSVAYAEILNKTGNSAVAYLPGPLNQSVVKSIRSWDLKYVTELDEINYHFVIVDVSDPEHISSKVDATKLVEIFDHHFGHEAYWETKLGKKSHIQPVGACATLIWEQAAALTISLSDVSANLLYTAIFSGTLNFNSTVTTDRDRKAFQQLKNFITVPFNWQELYYKDLNYYVLANPKEALIKDIKTSNIPNFHHTFIIGQLELWDSKSYLDRNRDTITQVLSSHGSPYWFLTAPSISEGKNYLVCNDPELQGLLTKLIGAKFTGQIGETPKLWLRKEILRELQNNPRV